MYALQRDLVPTGNFPANRRHGTICTLIQSNALRISHGRLTLFAFVNIQNRCGKRDIRPLIHLEYFHFFLQLRCASNLWNGNFYAIFQWTLIYCRIKIIMHHFHVFQSAILFGTLRNIDFAWEKYMSNVCDQTTEWSWLHIELCCCWESRHFSGQKKVFLDKCVCFWNFMHF